MCLYTVFEMLRPSKPHRQQVFCVFFTPHGQPQTFCVKTVICSAVTIRYTQETLSLLWHGTQFKRH